jgi:hypothetical protein
MLLLCWLLLVVGLVACGGARVFLAQYFISTFKGNNAIIVCLNLYLYIFCVVGRFSFELFSSTAPFILPAMETSDQQAGLIAAAATAVASNSHEQQKNKSIPFLQE